MIGASIKRTFVQNLYLMSPNIFPFEWAHPNAELLNAQIGRRSSLIYILLIGFFILILAALPLVKVDVTVQARGAIRDVQNNVALSSPIQGQVLYHHLLEDRKVEKGEKLLVLNSSALAAEQQRIEEQLKNALDSQHDLDALLHAGTNQPTLRSSVYQQVFSQHLRELNTLEIKKQYNLGVLQRISKLYKEQIVAKVEFEKAQLDADLASSELQLLEEQQRKAWEIEAQQVQQQLLELRSKQKSLQHQAENYNIYAPNSGFLVQTTGIKAGSYVMPGQQLALISTQDSLLAEVYIPARQIGYIQKGMPVRLLIDAYNFHEWGTITGKVQAVSSEIKIIHNTPVLVALVGLAQKELKLKNGYIGKVKKGMSLNARFFLQKRSLLALLYDKTEDWLDPRKPAQK